MMSADSNLETDNPGLKTPFDFKILLMSADEPAPGILTELEELPGGIVRVCSTLLELLLYLEHESFQLVMIIEEKSFSVDGQVAIDHLAKAHRGTPVLVTERVAVEKYFGKASKCVN